MIELTSDNVHRIFLSSLFTGNPSQEDLKRTKYVDSVMLKIGFDSAKLKENESDIIELLEQLPKEFKQSEGGGYSFLFGCMTQNNHQWGEQIRVDELVSLGLGIEKIEFLFPRDMWSILPGGVPYFVYNDD